MAFSRFATVKVIYKAETAGAPVRWANTYEVDGGFEGLFLGDAQLVLEGFALFARNLVYENFLVERVVMSSYAQDGEPYAPDTFSVLEVNERGTLAGGVGPATVLPLSNVLVVKRQTDEGRLGTLLLRGCLLESDIQSDAFSGAVTLTSAATLQSNIDANFADLQTAIAPYAMAMLSGSGTIPSNARAVTGLQVKGIGTKRLKNKSFKRTAGNPFAAIEGIVKSIGATAEVLNPVIQAFNAIPSLPDVPLLGD